MTGGQAKYTPSVTQGEENRRGDDGQLLVYIRRSYRRADAADVSDETQEQVARAMLPPGATVRVICDSGGHQSGATDLRSGYQELITRIRQGNIAGVAVYDLSRLARNARLMLNLQHELEAHRVTLYAGNLPHSKHDSAVGRFLFGQIALAAQFQRDLDSERMTAMNRQAFEQGRHRGLDPFGYRSRRGPDGKIVHPRVLDVVEEEAEVIRRIWRDLAASSTGDIAAALNAEGVKRRVDRPWTRDAIKDIQRRGRVYLGHAVTRRGAEETPGTHVPIIDLATYRAGVSGSSGRFRAAVRRKSYRTYALRGLVLCGQCGGKLHAQTRVNRGHEWSYYLCRHCDAPSVPAHAAEEAVFDAIRTLKLPASTIDRARQILLQRLQAPASGHIDVQRKRLEGRLTQLRDLYGWGDMLQPEYRAKVAETQRMLADLPDEDKVVLFDRHRKVVEDMAANLERATRGQRADLVRLLVERVVARGRTVRADDITWTAPVRPFFEGVAERPRTDSNRRRAP